MEAGRAFLMRSSQFKNVKPMACGFRDTFPCSIHEGQGEGVPSLSWPSVRRVRTKDAR